MNNQVEVENLYNHLEIQVEGTPSNSLISPAEPPHFAEGVPQPSKDGFFYIIKTADVPAGVYKIGKTCADDPNKRLCRYPKYSCCEYTVHVSNADLFEDIVMRKLKVAAKRRMEFGLEYYEEDIRTLIDLVHQLWLKYGHISEATLDKTAEQMKPNGWQYFVNEWMSKNTDASVFNAYIAYVDIMKTVFMTKDYAEFDYFKQYFESHML